MLIAALVCALLAITGIASPKAKAVATPGYDIEVQMLYCLNPSKPCNTPATITNSMYIQVETVSFTPGSSESTPDAVVFVCGRAYFDAQGNFHDVGTHVFAGFDKGWIKSEAEVSNAAPDSTKARGHIQYVRAYDSVTKGWGMAWGTIYTNNAKNQLASGGFNLWTYGPIIDEYANASGQIISKQVGFGQVECSTFHKVVTGVGNDTTFKAVIGSNS